MKKHFHKLVTGILFLSCLFFIYEFHQLEKMIDDLETNIISTHFTEKWFEIEMAKSKTRDELIEGLRVRLDTIEKKVREIHE